MPLDGLLFTALSRELGTIVENARIQGIFQPKPDQLLFSLRQPGKNVNLTVSIDPKMPSIHVTSGHFNNPPAPPAFCQVLRKHLIPGRILRVQQEPFERVLTVFVEGRDDAGERAVRALTVEMMGRFSNVILTMNRTIIDALKRVQGRDRDILPHRPYEPPRAPQQRSADAWEDEEMDRLLRLAAPDHRVDRLLPELILGIGPFAAREIIVRSGQSPGVTAGELSADDRHRLIDATRRLIADTVEHRIEPTVIIQPDRLDYWLFPLRTLTGKSRGFPDVMTMMDWVFETYRKEEATRQFRQRLLTAVDQHVKRVSKKAERQKRAVAAGQEGLKHRLHGDLITSYLHLIEPGAQEVTVANFFADNEPITLSLDPRLSPAENAARYYHQYQRAKKTVDQAGRHWRASLAEQRYLENVRLAVELSESIEEMEEIEEELIKEGYIRIEKRQKGRRSKPRSFQLSEPLVFRSSDGMTIKVGRNNRQNDILTMKQARAHHYWFHVRDMPGAHVIVETDHAAEPPEQTILEAAQLAAFYSSARHSSRVPVDYTQKSHVRKPKNARPGMVIYDNEQTVYVTPDDQILAAISRR